jgi:hypothetical protein
LFDAIWFGWTGEEEIALAFIADEIFHFKRRYKDERTSRYEALPAAPDMTAYRWKSVRDMR